MTTQTTAASAYRENAILTASPEKLVKMLYDGAIRHMEQTATAFGNAATARGAAAGESLSKAFAIVGELRGSLDMAAGAEIAGNLDRLYDFVLERLSQANMERRPEPIQDALRVMRLLKEGWDGIVPA